MPEPVTTIVVGASLFSLVGNVVSNVIATRTDAHLQAFVDQRFNHDIQDALHKAWKAACAELFERYREGSAYGNLPPDVRKFVNARADLFVASRTIDDLFPPVDLTASVTEIDVGRLFDTEHDAVNRVLLDALERLGLLGDLPGGLERQIRDALLNGLLFHFVEIGIKRDTKTRDALFFEQLTRVLRGTAATKDELRAIRTNLEQLDGYQQWQRDMLTDIAAGVSELLDRVKPIPTTIPHSIPAPPTDFQGRGKEIETLVAMLRAAKDGTVASICGVRGLSGIGKSTLAYQVAQELRNHFPDGHLFLALRGTSDTALSPEEALREMLRAFGKETDPNLTLAQLENDYRDTLHGKRVLILADNAKDVAQVKPLTPPPGCALLITSRRLIRFADMPDPVELGKLPEGEAVAFAMKICRKLGTDATTLTTLCGCLPLALRLSATRIAHSSSPIARQLTQLADERTRLRRMRGDDPEADIEAAFNQSFAALNDDAQTLLRRLGMFAASFDRGAAVEVARLPGMINDQYALDDVLDELRNLSLIDYDPATDRYSLHDLVRIFAIERLREKDEEEQTRLHYIVHYLAEVRVAQAQFLQGGENLLSGLKLFYRERAHIDALWTWVMQPPPHETRDALLLALADATVYIGDIRYDKRKERIPQLEAALAAARHQQNRAAEGRLVGGLGNAYVMLGDACGAIEYYKQQLVIVREIGDRQGEGNALGNSGNAYAMLGDTERATDCYKQRLTIAKEIGDRRGEGNALGNVGNVKLLSGEVRHAIECFKEQLAVMHELGDLRGEGSTLGNLGRAYANLGRVDLAIRHYEQAATVFEKLGDRHATGLILGNLGTAYSDLGNTQRAIEYHQQWLAIAQEIGDRRGEGGALGDLGKTYYMLGELDLAITFSTRALILHREVGDRHGEGIVLGNLGNAYSALGMANRAVEYYEQALIIAHELGDREGEVITSWNLGDELAKQGNLQRAINLMQRRVEYEYDIGHHDAKRHMVVVEALRQRRSRKRSDYKDTTKFEEVLNYYCNLLVAAEQHEADVAAWNRVSEAEQELFTLPLEDIGVDADELRTNIAMWHRNRADTLIELDRLDEAVAAIERARALEPDVPRLAELEAALAQARGETRQVGGV